MPDGLIAYAFNDQSGIAGPARNAEDAQNVARKMN